MEGQPPRTAQQSRNRHFGRTSFPYSAKRDILEGDLSSLREVKGHEVQEANDIFLILERLKTNRAWDASFLMELCRKQKGQ